MAKRAVTVAPTELRASIRAARMPADERRASIVAAATPLVKVHGTDVTTRQIAEAAGVAEGTLFRVFDDKEAIVHAVVTTVIDPGPMMVALDAVDVDRPFAAVLADLVAALQQRLRVVIEILMAVRWIPPEPVKANQQWDNDPIMDRIVGILDVHRSELNVPAKQAGRLLRLLIFAGTHPMINDGRALTAEEVVSTLLDGIRRQPAIDSREPPARPRTATTRKPTGAKASQPSAKPTARGKPRAKSA